MLSAVYRALTWCRRRWLYGRMVWRKPQQYVMHQAGAPCFHARYPWDELAEALEQETEEVYAISISGDGIWIWFTDGRRSLAESLKEIASCNGSSSIGSR